MLLASRRTGSSRSSHLRARRVGVRRALAVQQLPEYEEEIYLALDGTATVNVNASIASIVALRGANLPTDPRARVDRGDVRRFFEGPGVRVTSVSLSRRHTRRFAHVAIDVDDVRKLSQAGAVCVVPLPARRARATPWTSSSWSASHRSRREQRRLGRLRDRGVPDAHPQRDPLSQHRRACSAATSWSGISR
jgi:hypothetical protein